MFRRKQHPLHLLLIIIILATVALAPLSGQPAYAKEQIPLACTEGTQASNALYQICMPDNWNGTLILWSHGYVAPNQPLAIQNTYGETSLPDAYAQFGFAFATTSFSKNGLAIREGIDDLLDLVTIFNTQHTTPTRTILQGASLGALAATLAIEENPDVFDGGLALCAPTGNFQAQVDYFAHGRVLFDYFFPDLLAPSPVEIPQTLIDDWTNVSNTVVIPSLANPANAGQVQQLLSTASIPFDTAVPTTTIEAISSVLWFNIQGTNDGVATLGGSSYDNSESVYSGSFDDEPLNDNVARFTADQAALDEISTRYQTSGQLQVPLVTMHTTLDPVVPYSQAVLYQAKVEAAQRSALYQHLQVERYGHCQFTEQELFGALTLLNQMIDGAGTTTIPDATMTIFMPILVNE